MPRIGARLYLSPIHAGHALWFSLHVTFLTKKLASAFMYVHVFIANRFINGQFDLFVHLQHSSLSFVLVTELYRPPFPRSKVHYSNLIFSARPFKRPATKKQQASSVAQHRSSIYSCPSLYHLFTFFLSSLSHNPIDTHTHTHTPTCPSRRIIAPRRVEILPPRHNNKQRTWKWRAPWSMASLTMPNTPVLLVR
jgi:hypothetical protein